MKNNRRESILMSDERNAEQELTSILSLQDHEQVHSTNFRDLVVGPVEPEHLLKSLLFGLALRREMSFSKKEKVDRRKKEKGGPYLDFDGRSIVGSHLLVSTSAWPGPDELGVGQQVGSQAGREIGANRTQEDVQQGTGRPCHPQSWLKIIRKKQQNNRS